MFFKKNKNDKSNLIGKKVVDKKTLKVGKLCKNAGGYYINISTRGGFLPVYLREEDIEAVN